MPKTYPNLLRYSLDDIDPVKMAFQYYLLQLHEKYPGFLAQFAIDQTERIVSDALPAPCPYSFHGRLFFSSFSINNEVFEPRYDEEFKAKKMLHPIKQAMDKTEKSLAENKNLLTTLYAFNEVNRAVLETTLNFLKSQNPNRPKESTKTTDLISQAVNRKPEILESLITQFSQSSLSYTLKNIATILEYRMAIADSFFQLPSGNLIEHLLLNGLEGHVASPALIEQTKIKIAGAIIFKLIAEAEIGFSPLTAIQKRIMTRICHIPTNDPEAILKSTRDEYKAKLQTSLSSEAMLKQLVSGKDNPEVDPIQSQLGLFSSNLNNELAQSDFIALGENAFIVLFTHLNQYSQALSDYKNTQAQVNLAICAFIFNHFNEISDAKEALYEAVAVLNSLRFAEKEDRRTLSPFRKFHQDCLKKYTARLDELHRLEQNETLKAFASTLRPVSIKSGEAYEAETKELLKKASEGKRASFHPVIDQRTKSSFSLTQPEKPHDLRRHLSHFNLFHPHESVPVKEKPTKPSRFSPHFHRRKHQRRSDSEAPLASTTQAPIVAPNNISPLTHPKRKTRKREIPETPENTPSTNPVRLSNAK